MVMRAMCNQLLKAANDARSSAASETVQ